MYGTIVRVIGGEGKESFALAVMNFPVLDTASAELRAPLVKSEQEESRLHVDVAREICSAQDWLMPWWKRRRRFHHKQAKPISQIGLRSTTTGTLSLSLRHGAGPTKGDTVPKCVRSV